MASKKELKPHIDYLDDCLALLKTKVGEAKEYLTDVRWQDLGGSEEREKEFKFQSTLVNNYVAWLNDYAKLSGLVDALNELNKSEEKEVRKGSFRSPFAEMVKGGELDD